MKTYNTYQEAKIANPEMEVYKLKGGRGFASCDNAGDFVRFTDLSCDAEKCNPANYCMTLADFLDAGHLLADGDVVLTTYGSVGTMGENGYYCVNFNRRDRDDENVHILRAATLEEKIGTTDDDRNELKPSCRVEFDNTPQQVESFGGADSKAKIASFEWGGLNRHFYLPSVGERCVYFVANPNDYQENMKYHLMPMNCVARVGLSGQLCVLLSDDYSFVTVCNDAWIRKPETPQQREERERIEAAYDLYCEFTNTSSHDATCYSIEGFSKLQLAYKWLAIVDKTNYRKETKNAG
jgi:hypothetical protein